MPRFEPADLGLQPTLTRSQDDPGSLRIVDPAHPSSSAVATGAPWFMALFGHDSLLSSYMATALDPALALGTLQMLARSQGVKVDSRTEEQPGRIRHETRLGLDFPLSSGGGSVYYGFADATTLFVLLLGELLHWGALRFRRLRFPAGSASTCGIEACRCGKERGGNPSPAPRPA